MKFVITGPTRNDEQERQQPYRPKPESSFLSLSDAHRLLYPNAPPIANSTRLRALLAQLQLLILEVDGATWIPAFQFDPRGRPRDASSELARALHSPIEGRASVDAVCHWLLSANPALDDGVPALRFATDPERVIAAAFAWSKSNEVAPSAGPTIGQKPTLTKVAKRVR